MDLGEKWGKNGIFCQVGPVTAQKVWCHGRLLNTNLFYTTNRLDWDKRGSYREHQDSNCWTYDQTLRDATDIAIINRISYKEIMS